MPTPKPRMREELYINLNPLQRGGITPPEARKTALAYVDGYSTCDYCPGTIHQIRNPPISDFIEELAEFLGMDCAILTHGCREAQHIIIHAITRPGQTIIIDANKHYTSQVTAELNQLKTIEVPNTGYSEYKITPESYGTAIETAKKQIGHKPALVLLTHVDWLYGNLVDATEVGEICQEYEIPFLLNTAYSSGRLPIDGKALQADFIACSGHKSWAAGAGTIGILAMKKEWKDKILKPSKYYDVKPLELLGCTTRGTSTLTLMAAFPHVKERVKYWSSEVDKARWLSSQMEAIPSIKQLGEKPHNHDLLRFETPVLHKIAQKHRRRGYYLYEELRKRRIVGIKPGKTKSFDLSTYRLTKEQLSYVLDSFKGIINKLSPKN